jgi:hypothetical protein
VTSEAQRLQARSAKGAGRDTRFAKRPLATGRWGVTSGAQRLQARSAKGAGRDSQLAICGHWQVNPADVGPPAGGKVPAPERSGGGGRGAISTRTCSPASPPSTRPAGQGPVASGRLAQVRAPNCEPRIALSLNKPTAPAAPASPRDSPRSARTVSPVALLLSRP